MWIGIRYTPRGVVGHLASSLVINLNAFAELSKIPGMSEHGGKCTMDYYGFSGPMMEPRDTLLHASMADVNL